jgi:four helix bundle protein
MQFAEDCYRLTRGFPKEELYGLTSQLRRCVTSVAANIAEGYGREQRGSFVQFLRIAQGSLKEAETHLLIAERVGLVERKQIGEHLQQADELGRMLRSFIRALQRKSSES